MDIALEGILMIVLMAIILLFVIISLSGFFAPKGSGYYFKQFVSMASSACTSTQSSTSMGFSTPPSAVFQIYDNATCNSTLFGNQNIFNLSTPYSPPAMYGNYAICYARINTTDKSALGQLSNSQQYYLKPFQINNAIKFSSSAPYLLYGMTYNHLSVPAFQENESTGGSGSYITISFNRSINTSQFKFQIQLYQNTSSSVSVQFGSVSQNCVKSYPTAANVTIPLSTIPTCGINISNVTFGISEPAPLKPTLYDVNMTLVPFASQTLGQNAILAQQCLDLPSRVSSGALINRTITCEPIACGGNSFMLTDTLNRPFLGISLLSFNYFGIQAGVGDLQMITPNSEAVISKPLV